MVARVVKIESILCFPDEMKEAKMVINLGLLGAMSFNKCTCVLSGVLPDANSNTLTLVPINRSIV